MFRQQLLKMMFFFLFVFLFHWNHMSFVVFCLKMTAFGACQRFAGNSQPRFGWSSGRAG